MNDSKVADNNNPACFGYRQELKCSMGRFSSFTAGFLYISIVIGLFQMFPLGYGLTSLGFFWTWPFIMVSQLLAALCLAKLTSLFPLSCRVYQWAKFKSYPFLGWKTGWINNYNITPIEFPFGEYKQSCIGRENSLAAKQQFTLLKSVYVELGCIESTYL